MRDIAEIKADLDKYKKQSDIPKELLKEYQEASLKEYLYEEEDVWKRANLTTGIPLDRLEQTCNAERDGRCVVLPCKVGDVVYIVATVSQKILKTKVLGVAVMGTETHFVTDCGFCKNTSLGKTVFLTQEEAEKALEVKNDTNQI